MIMKTIRALLAFIALLIVAVGATLLLTMPEAPGADAPTFVWLQPGPYRVAASEREWIDPTRPTSANKDFPGAPQRSLPTTIWYPEEFAGPYPLIVYSHGFLSSRSEALYLLKHLASHGYVVVAADFPLTGGNAPGGANINDVSNQPQDVSFLIGTVLALAGPDKPFAGQIDAGRIGIMGLSLGGFSTTLTAFHPRLRERRVKAAISIAGPSVNLTRRFYELSRADIPFLMIAGTADRLIDYAANAAVIPDRVPGGALLTITAGNHIGFVGMAEPAFRLIGNADSLACASVNANIDEAQERTNADLFSAADGIVFDTDAPVRCAQEPPPQAGHPGRQHMITKVGVLSFFESVFASSPARRATAKQVLAEHLGRDFKEASFRAASEPVAQRR